MSKRHHHGSQLRWFRIALAGVVTALGACAADPGAPEQSGQDEQDLSACSVSFTTNTYQGAPAYWGTLMIKNNGAAALTSPQISFTVPGGVTCDYDPSGWKHTQSGTTCTTAFKVTEQGRQSSPRFPWKTGKFALLGLEIRNLTQRRKDAEAQKGPEFRVRDFLRLCVCLAPLR